MTAIVFIENKTLKMLNPKILMEIIQKRVQQLSIKTVYLTRQFSNGENIRAHFQTTGREMLEHVKERIDAILSRVETGGTPFDVWRALRKVNPGV